MVTDTEPMPKRVVGYTEPGCSKLKNWKGFLKPNFEPGPIYIVRMSDRSPLHSLRGFLAIALAVDLRKTSQVRESQRMGDRRDRVALCSIEQPLVHQFEPSGGQEFPGCITAKFMEIFEQGISATIYMSKNSGHCNR